jgi:hypothetical protein
MSAYQPAPVILGGVADFNRVRDNTFTEGLGAIPAANALAANAGFLEAVRQRGNMKANKMTFDLAKMRLDQEAKLARRGLALKLAEGFGDVFGGGGGGAGTAGMVAPMQFDPFGTLNTMFGLRATARRELAEQGQRPNVLAADAVQRLQGSGG